MDFGSIVFFLSVLFAVLSLFEVGKDFFWKNKIEHKKYIPETDDLIRSTLRGREYFQQLTETGKLKFIRRVRILCVEKEFEGKNGLIVTDEMKILVSACIAQIMYGREVFKIGGFRKVLVFPEVFFQPQIKRLVKGFAASGMIAISWKDFEKGFSDNNDNYNLGLHEVAHALHIVAFKGSTELKVFIEEFREWSQKSHGHFIKLRAGLDSFLRDYGGSNFHEFFAVCVEHFFESPQLFAKENPELFESMVDLLNQDPRNINNDYKPNLQKPVPQVPHRPGYQLGSPSAPRLLVRKSPIKRENDTILQLTAFGLIFGLAIMSLVSVDLVLNYVDKAIIVLLFGSLSFAFYPTLKSKGYVKNAFQYSFFAYFGIGMNITALLLVLNNLLPSTQYSEQHKIVGYHKMEKHGRIILEEDRYNSYPSIRETSKPFNAYHPDSVEYSFRRGALGIPCKESQRFYAFKTK